MSGVVKSVVAKAPAKINLALHVGAPDSSGYHPLLTAFQAIDLWETVTISEAPTLSVSVDTSGRGGLVPTGPENTAWRAAELMAHSTGHKPQLRIHIDKRIPVAGGMAGGSADAAATLVALNAYWSLGLEAKELAILAREIGADVPFSLHGGAAIGRGRGDVLERMEIATPLHWVVVPSSSALSTPEVYRHFDKLTPNPRGLPPSLSPDFLRAWSSGAAEFLAGLMSNDLQSPAIALLPELSSVLDDVVQAGALTSAVSGSGPTVFGLAASEADARNIASRLKASGYPTEVTRSVEGGARLLD